MTLSIGAKLPEFSLPATTIQTINNQDLAGKYVVIYFYPKDSTPGCTTEGLDFNDRLEAFQKLNCEILGVSMDSMHRHENFKAKQGFKFELISDEDAVLCQAFGVYQLKKNFGKEYMGIVRSTFLFDPKGELIHSWSPVKVKDHAQEVLDTLNSL
jgi:peroxiredoxin Q/BCP